MLQLIPKYYFYLQGSTHDEQNSPAMPLESQEEQNNDGEEIQNAESDMELDLLAESESDSEDSNGDDVEENQRSGTNSGTNRSGHSRADLVDSGRSHDNDGVDYYSGAESTADVDDEDGEVEEEDDDDTQTIIEPIVQRLISGSYLGLLTFILIKASSLKGCLTLYFGGRFEHIF